MSTNFKWHKSLLVAISLLSFTYISANVTGNVFKDIPMNGNALNTYGVKDSNEKGIKGLTVKGVDSSGNSATTTTDANGDFTLTGLSGKVRVEVVYPSYLKESPDANNKNSAVRFVNDGDSVNFAFHDPLDFVDTTNPVVVGPIYANGKGGAGTTAGDAATIMHWNYRDSGAPDLTKNYAKAYQTGALWGVAYSKTTDTIYTAAVVRRHMGLGPLGIGGIYKVTGARGGNPQFSNWLDVVSDLGVNLGSVDRSSDACHQLPNEINKPSHDPDAYVKAGRKGLGDIDLSQDEKTLYVMDLTNKQLLVIDVASKSLKKTLSIPDPGCNGGDYRPWAISTKGGLFVGVVCSAETSQNRDDLVAHVMKYNGTTFQSIYSTPLNFQRGNTIYNVPGEWQPWTTDTTWHGESHPEPILSDIEMDESGAMILAFMDRYGFITGNNNYPPQCNATNLVEGHAGGDILRACPNGSGGWTLENNGTCGGVTTSGAGNNQGPGGGEYYVGDAAGVDDSGLIYNHQEIGSGSLLQLLGSGQVMTTVFDPIEKDSGGVKVLNNTTGRSEIQKTVYPNEEYGGDPNNIPPHMGKAVGIGDIEFLSATAPLEVGNRVWDDSDGDGIQDAGEAGIDGVKVQLVCGGTKVAEVTTANGGYYIFSNANGTDDTNHKYNISQLQPGNPNNCLIRIANYASQTPLNGKQVSPANAGNNRQIDSNGVLSGANVDVTIASSDIAGDGANNHSFDFGFTKPKKACIGDYVWEDVNRDGLQDAWEPKLEGVTVKLLGSDGTTELNSTTTDANGVYKFCNLVAGDYYIKVVPPAGYIITTKDAGDNSKDSDVDPNSGKSDKISFGATSDDLTWDIGLYKPLTCPAGYKKYEITQNGGKRLYDGGDTLIDISSEFGSDLNNPFDIDIQNFVTWDGYDNRKNAGTQPNESVRVVFKDKVDNSLKATSYTTDIADGVNYDKKISNLGTINVNNGASKAYIAHISDDTYGNGDHSSSNSVNVSGFCYKLTKKTANPAIDLEKFTNGEDADTPTGPYIKVGGSVTWTYKVKNIGNVILSDITLVDNKLGNISCPRTTLNPNEEMNCTKSGTAVKGQYENNATVTAKYNTTTVTDSDPSHYFGSDPKIDLEKFTNGENADTPTGPYIKVGDVVTWKYQVKNIGNVVLTNITITDNPTQTITCPKTTLAVGEEMNCTATGTAVAGQYENNATVTAKSPDGSTVTDKDPSHYFGIDSKIDIEKCTQGGSSNNCLDADTGTGPHIDVNGSVTWKYVITNKGNSKLTNIVLTDSKEGNITCPKSELAVGESMTCSKSGKAIEGQYENNATVTAKDSNGKIVTDSDPSHYFGDNLKIDIEKFTNGKQADKINDADVPVLIEGQKVTWEYVVKNIGNVPLRIDSIKDDKEGVITCPKTTLAVGEEMNCTSKSGIAVVGNYENHAEVNATDTNTNKKVSDSDPSHYKGKEAACIGDKVWHDINANGIQDNGEVGIAGATVELLDSNGNAVKDANGSIVKPQTTGSDGKYKFCQLIPGNYKIKITPPTGYYLSPKDKTGSANDEDFNKNTNDDSDIDPTTKESVVVNLKSGETDLTWDAGVYKPVCLCGIAWKDSNVNGKKDANEEPIPNTKVILKDENGNSVTNVFGETIGEVYTNDMGTYKFCNIIPGKYKLEFYKEADENGAPYITTTQGGDSKVDEFKIGGAQTKVFELQSGDDCNTTKTKDKPFVGFIQEICLGDFVWYDKNLNGIQDSDEPGVIGIPVSITYADGSAVRDINDSLIKPTKTNDKGKYRFCHLMPSRDYKIKFKLPEGYHATFKDKGSDIRDNDADESGNIEVTRALGKRPVQDNMSLDLGIYCECDDYLIHPERYKKLRFEAVNIFGIIALVAGLFVLVRRED